MNNVNSTIDLTLLPDSSLYSLAKKIVNGLADRVDTNVSAFSLKDVTKAMANFQTASVKAEAGDTTSVAIRDLAKEALISVINAITDQETIHEKLKFSAS